MPTILFTAKLTASGATLPSKINAKIAEGTINGFPFRAPIKNGSLQIDKAILQAAAIKNEAAIELTRFDEEPEVRLPLELNNSLEATPAAQATWQAITPLARRDWVLWITSAKQPKTRLSRIAKAADMLAKNKRRPCCFSGLAWLTKDHPNAATWTDTPKLNASKIAVFARLP